MVDVDVSISQGVNKVTGLEREDKTITTGLKNVFTRGSQMIIWIIRG